MQYHVLHIPVGGLDGHKSVQSPEKLNDTFEHVLEFATLRLSEDCFCEVWPIPRAWFKALLSLACKVACDKLS